MNLMLVGIGGLFGGLCRFQLGKLLSRTFDSRLPVGTFFINITGAALLGLLVSAGAEGRAYLLLGEGFFGAYTTFSTFMYEGFRLFRENETLNAFIYILGTLVLGITGYVAGYALGKWLM